jgi:hypothetical protein
MKITLSQLKRIIKEEASRVNEALTPPKKADREFRLKLINALESVAEENKNAGYPITMNIKRLQYELGKHGISLENSRTDYVSLSNPEDRADAQKYFLPVVNEPEEGQEPADAFGAVSDFVASVDHRRWEQNKKYGV